MIESSIDYGEYLTFTPADGGEYYRLDIPKGIMPPKIGTRLVLNGVKVVTLKPNDSASMFAGRGGPVAKMMEENGIGYLVNCLPEGHEWL